MCGVSFNVEEGEFLTIFGPSGSGKSTLLRLTGCLDRPDEGEIFVDGHEPRSNWRVHGTWLSLTYLLSSFMQPQQQDTVFQAPENQRMTVNPVFSPEWTIIAFVFAIIVCVIFGLYPARKAAKLDPVEALRYE